MGHKSDNGLLGDKLDNLAGGEWSQWSIYNADPRCRLSALDIPWIISRGRDRRHDNFHAPSCVMKWHFYCIIFTASLLVSLLLILLFMERNFLFFWCFRRHPPTGAVIATLHNSWQNYGRKLAHNYAHSKVILNVYLAEFLTAFWLVELTFY